jgi:hypothetical protein
LYTSLIEPSAQVKASDYANPNFTDEALSVVGLRLRALSHLGQESLRARLSPCSSVILTAEQFSDFDTVDSLAKFGRLLACFSSKSPEFIYYVRKPDAWFKSMTLEFLKRGIAPSSFINSLDRLRRIVTSHAIVFGNLPVVRQYERSMLTRGDIVYDFLQTMMPDLDIEQFVVEESDANPSISAEAGFLLAQWRQERFPGGNRNLRPKVVTRLSMLLRNYETSRPRRPLPHFQPEFSRKIHQETRQDIRWMKDALDIDLTAPPPAGTPPQDGKCDFGLRQLNDQERVRKIFQLDDRYLYELTQYLGNEGYKGFEID